MLADSHAEVLVHRTEHGNVRLPLPAFDAWVSVHPSQRGNEIDPTQETKHLHQPCKDPDRHCQRDDAVEAERLAEQHHGPDQQEAREHEHPPQQNQRRPSGVEPFKDLRGRSAQDVRILEALPEQREGRIEPERSDDQGQPRGDLDTHEERPAEPRDEASIRACHR